MNTRHEFLKRIGLLSGGGETYEHFWPTPISDVSLRDKRYAQGGKGLGYAVKTGEMITALISSAVGSLANPYQPLVSDEAKPMNDGCGPPCVEFARYSDRHGCWLKTSQGYSQQKMFAESEEPSSEEWCGTWPRSGIVSDGIAYRLPPLVPRISGRGCSLWGTPQAHERAQSPRKVDHGIQLANQVAMWPTPTEHGNYNKKGASQHSGDGLATAVAKFPTPCKSDATGGAAYSKPPSRQGSFLLREVTRGALNPTWVEWLMGFPLGWTDLDASATP